ncbi:Alpha-2-macroglobulin domain protein [Candidatus Sulfopaludibacter sp. SbA3]|nr:Alpha-2-macroglobulin domain protein [Candidatus Sulfopaludibacter sp. SbA3]
MKKYLKLILTLAAVATGLSQSEDQPYFALSSNQTFGTHSKPSVSLSAWAVDSLEFRVYRIVDPVRFFQQIENPHEFGARTPAPPHERTLLERIHFWKRSLRASIQRGIRAQFTESPSAHFEKLLPSKSTPQPGSRDTHFAEAPVLNAQQLVLSFVQPVQSHSRWERETVPVRLTAKGVYIVEAVKGELRAYTVLIVSDSVLMTKTGKGRVVNMLMDRATGEPIQDAKIWMLGRDANLGNATTDAEGVAILPVPSGHPDDVRILAHKGADYALTTLSSYAFAANQASWMGYVYTDRPVYRPGHTVHFKGILRWRTAAGYEVPAGKAVSVTIQDQEQKPIYQKSLTTSATGTINDDLPIPTSATLGNYFIEIKSTVGDGYMSGSFEVQEYKKPEYEVRVAPSKTRVVQGETVQAAIDARYYFGEPVSSAKVHYAVYRDHYWFPLWYDPDDSTAEDLSAGDNEITGDQISEGDGELDADGKLSINVDTAISEHKQDFLYRVEAHVTDLGKREIVGKGWFVATYGSFVVNVTPEHYFYAPGSTAAITMEARDYDNKPVATAFHVKVFSYNYYDRQFGEVKTETSGSTDASGKGTVSVNVPKEGGSYRVEAAAHTPEGRDVQDTVYFWVSGGVSRHTRNDRKEIQIIPDKKTYHAGDTAKLLLVTGQPNTPIWVSVEGRDLQQYKLVRSSESTAEFDIPVTAADEPGISFSAAYVRKGDLYTGNKYLKVPPEQHQLNVKLATDKPQYQPGQTADYTIDVTGSDGQPVPRGEFSLGVVDEAIYAIRRDTLEDPLTFFYGRSWNSVDTENSLNFFFSGEAGKRRMQLAQLRAPSRLAQLKPERMVEPKIRKAFPDTAFWATDIVTDAAGHAHAKVEFPDSLTTWRATARGVTPDTKVGGAVLKTIVRKNLILRLVVPRFFVQGDEVVISAVVHNYLTDTKTARVSLDVSGLDILEGETKEVSIPSRGEARVDWRVRAQQVHSATITGKALTNEESDAMQLDLPVNMPGVKLSQSHGGAIAAGTETSFDLTFPANIHPGSRLLNINISPSVAGSLFGAMEYLTGFPYGCVEQTMSSFLPNITVRQTVRDLGLKVNLDDAALQEKIRAGLDRLYNFQHEDGGWGWWETDESHPFMTAYVVAGLMQAKAAGIAVQDETIAKGVTWLQQDFTKDPQLMPDLRAYMLYSLAVAGSLDAARFNQIYDKRSAMSPYGLAILGLALEQAKDARAAEIAALLERTVQQDPEQAWWPATRDQMLDFSEDVTAEATAYAVKFLSHQRKESPLLPKAALWLMNHRNEGFWWSSTKQTAMVIYGLTDYLRATGELNPNFTVTVFVNDRQVLSRTIDQATNLNPPPLTLDDSKLQPGVNHIRVTATGQGRVYYSARAEYYSTEDKLQKTGTASLNVLRDYFRLVPGKDGDKIVYDTAPLTGPAASGDVIAVRLTVTGSEWKYLMLEDPIPAGTELIERDAIYQLRNRPPWWTYYFTRRELHDDLSPGASYTTIGSPCSKPGSPPASTSTSTC